MKLSITDKFLWDVYNFSKVGDILDYLSSNKYQQIHMMLGQENPIYKQYRKDLGSRRFSQLIKNLKRRNYITSSNMKKRPGILMTKNGASRVLEASFTMEKYKKRRDGKWIMIMFDIPRHHKAARHLLRSVLRNLGYTMYQYSVWVTPYDVSKKTEKLFQYYSLDIYVKTFLIEKL